MSENNLIYEITQQLNNKKTVQNDLMEAMSLVKNYFNDKYINKIQTVINENYASIEKQPTKEIQLLNAIRPFLDKSQQEQFNNLISSYTAITAIQNIKSNLQQNYDTVSIQSTSNLNSENKSVDSSIKSDGVYDIDENCIKQKSISSNNDNTFPQNIIGIMVILLLSTI